MEEMNWQPIETAPQGVRVLVTGHFGHGYVEVGHLSGSFKWRGDNGDPIEGQPTLWQPLPMAATSARKAPE